MRAMSDAARPHPGKSIDLHFHPLHSGKSSSPLLPPSTKQYSLILGVNLNTLFGMLSSITSTFFKGPLSGPQSAFTILDPLHILTLQNSSNESQSRPQPPSLPLTTRTTFPSTVSTLQTRSPLHPNPKCPASPKLAPSPQHYLRIKGAGITGLTVTRILSPHLPPHASAFFCKSPE